MSERYWSAGSETASQERIAQRQRESLRELMAACARVPYYRDALRAAGISPDQVREPADLAAVPFFGKEQLRELQPWGVLAVGLDQVARFHATTGTTGLPCNIAFTRQDLANIAELGARNLTAMGVQPGDVAWQSYGYGLWMGGSSLDLAFETVGVTTFPAGPGRTALAVERLTELGVTTISCTPSFAVQLAERAAELGRDLARSRLRVGILGGETMTQAARARLGTLMPPGFRAHNTYGTTELGGPFLAGTCEYALEQGTFHVWADHFLIEIVDPSTGQPVTAPGIPGELVVTTLCRQGAPMLRWRTRDLTAWAPDRHDCPCGRTGHPKISWISGRSDDMIKVRGALVLPSQVEEIICATAGTGTSWQLVVDKDAAGLRATEATVYVELASDGAAGMGDVARVVAGRLAERLGVRIPVMVTRPRELPRYEGKARRVLTAAEFAAAVPRPAIVASAGTR